MAKCEVKPVHILLLLLCVAIGQAHTSHAQMYQMDPVYVSASRLSSETEAGSRLIAVLDSAQIAQTGATNIADLLSVLPGIHARTRGPLGVQTDLEMAGATFSQVLVLVDGMRINDPQTGHHTLNTPLRPSDLQRVEVVYGGGSAVHGPDAFGGVVNLVLRRAPQRHVQLSGHWGDAEEDSDVAAVAQRANMRYGWQGTWGTLSLSAGKERSDGYRDTTEFDTDRLYAQLRIPLASGQLQLSGGVEDKAFGAKDFYAPYPSKEWTRAWLYSGQYQRSIGPHRDLTSRVLYRRHRDRFVLWRHNPDAYENRHVNELATIETHISQTWGASRIILGTELSHQRIDSNNLGQHHQTRGALFAESLYPVGRWSISASARIDYSTAYAAELSPALRIARHVGSTLLSVGLGRAFRAPSFTEFYYEDPNNVGNPDLNAERAWIYDTGLQAQILQYLHVQGQTYVRFESNLVDYVRPIEQPPWRAQNLGKVRTLGVLINVAYRKWEYIQPSLNYSWNDKTQNLADGFESKYVFTQPRHQIGLHIGHHLPADIRIRWRYDYRQRTRADDYAVAQVSLSRSTAHGSVRLHIRNLTDARYEEIAGVPMPGRWFEVETIFDL